MIRRPPRSTLGPARLRLFHGDLVYMRQRSIAGRPFDRFDSDVLDLLLRFVELFLERGHLCGLPGDSLLERFDLELGRTPVGFALLCQQQALLLEPLLGLLNPFTSRSLHFCLQPGRAAADLLLQPEIFLFPFFYGPSPFLPVRTSTSFTRRATFAKSTWCRTLSKYAARCRSRTRVLC